MEAVVFSVKSIPVSTVCEAVDNTNEVIVPLLGAEGTKRN